MTAVWPSAGALAAASTPATPRRAGWLSIGMLWLR